MQFSEGLSQVERQFQPLPFALVVPVKGLALEITPGHDVWQPGGHAKPAARRLVTAKINGVHEAVGGQFTQGGDALTQALRLLRGERDIVVVQTQTDDFHRTFPASTKDGRRPAVRHAFAYLIVSHARWQLESAPALGTGLELATEALLTFQAL
ncbi:hypothetical protein [Oligosphaera ethanolica]|uniref:Uncharacterized protein n=1 Tax=Oligosphaera ethanolica TaxID=760260 RepID=A0AAE3VI01_9BACT|nr:hypothetical protein [Oligosphaera ethanolica]MDQ0290509.1 hypothetical protein [Oligosphaera ethanolica]